MSRDPAPHRPPPRSRLPLVGGAVAVALGVGAFVLLRAPATSPATARLSPPPATAVAPVNPALPAATAPAPAHDASPYRTAGYAELLRLLRAELAGSRAAASAALAEIARTRPALAIDLAAGLGTPEETAEWMTSVMRDWTERDPAQAWQWLRQQTHRMDDLAHGQLPAVVFDTMAGRQPDALLPMLEELLQHRETVGPFATEVAAHLGIEALISHGQVPLARETLERWAGDPTKPAVGAAPYEAVATAIGEKAPEEAAQWLLSLPPSENRAAALATFAGMWGDRDPQAALSWAETLAPAAGQLAAIQRVFADWVERDAAPAGEWLGAYLARTGDQPEADQLIEGLINLPSAVKGDPRVALQWTSLMADPQRRQIYEENVTLRWGRREPAAAIEHIWKSPTIPPERKPALVQAIHAQSTEFDE